jgi:uncharacterized protein (UPF0179 family)
MPQVTLIGKELAIKNFEFIYHGPLQECKSCKLTHICFNLKPYQTYKITKIRKKNHTCPIHEGEVIVVEVKQQPSTIAIDKKFSKGFTTTLTPIKCDKKLCKYYDICVTQSVKPGKKYRILSLSGDIDCPLGKKIQKAEIKE